MTELLYYSTPIITECGAAVLSCEKDERSGAYKIILDRTMIYPEGGGQPADRGSIVFRPDNSAAEQTVRISDARTENGSVVHFCDAEIPAGTIVRVILDVDTRLDHAQQHTGEHIVSGLANKLFGAVNVGFHMAADYCTIDFDIPLEQAQLEELERAANAAVTTDGGSQYLPIIRPLYSQYNSDELGFIYIEMSPNVVTIPLKTAGTYQNNDFYLTLEDHSYVYSNYTLTDATPSYEITGDLSSIASFSDTIVKEISNANGKFVSISVPLAAEHCYITQLITVNTFYGQLASIIFVIVACAVITGIILHTIFNHMINHPVQELQVRMKHISEGIFERDSSIEWQHELGDIGRSINDLAEDVKTLMDQRIRKKNNRLKKL